MCQCICITGARGAVREHHRGTVGSGGGGSELCRHSLSFVGCLGLARASRGYPWTLFWHWRVRLLFS